MNRVDRKRGHPLLGLVIPVAVISTCLAFFKCVRVLNDPEPGLTGYLGLAAGFILAIAATGICIWLLMRSWRIESEGGHVVLFRGSHEVYRGLIDDLEMTAYEGGVVVLRNSCGNVFTFPAFGRILERFVIEPTTETKLHNKPTQANRGSG